MGGMKVAARPMRTWATAWGKKAIKKIFWTSSFNGKNVLNHSVRTTWAEERDGWGPDWAVGEDEEEPLVALHGVEAVQVVGGGHREVEEDVGGTVWGDDVSQEAAPTKPALQEPTKSIIATVSEDLKLVHIRTLLDCGVTAFRLIICWAAPHVSWHCHAVLRLQEKRKYILYDTSSRPPANLLPYKAKLKWYCDRANSLHSVPTGSERAMRAPSSLCMSSVTWLGAVPSKA